MFVLLLHYRVQIKRFRTQTTLAPFLKVLADSRLRIEMAVREQGAKARLRVLHFGEELFATIGAAKHGYDALNMRNVFRKIPRRECDVAEEGSGEEL